MSLLVFYSIFLYSKCLTYADYLNCILVLPNKPAQKNYFSQRHIVKWWSWKIAKLLSSKNISCLWGSQGPLWDGGRASVHPLDTAVTPVGLGPRWCPPSPRSYPPSNNLLGSYHRSGLIKLHQLNDKHLYRYLAHRNLHEKWKTYFFPLYISFFF